ncbi:MAG TPA: hypothetical protein VGC36_00915 [Rhizomicrobium sp.]
MLRFKVLASAVPLAFAAFFARGELFAASRPCVAVADMSVQLTSLFWQAERHVSFTEDPAAATVRVLITDDAEAADFAVIDDIDNAEAGGCQTNPATRLVSISVMAAASEPVIYLSKDGPADYRIYVNSRTFSARDAAALIVGARGGHPHVQAASL